jgi:NAD(P)-dependent dehydrogenase (short-subunit alcohol dehydrogenase family)
MAQSNELRNSRFMGKVAIVTGAGRGMGRAVALLLAREGAKVVVNDISGQTANAVADEARTHGADAMAVAGDVSKPEDVRRVVDATISQFGRIDILVNNAGIARPTSPLETIGEDEWASTVAVNLTGTFNFMKAVLPHMKERRSGKIVNISSIAGRSYSTFAGAHYTASKAGVLGLTRHAAREAAPFNVNINAVAPGTVDTPLLHEHATPQRIADVAQARIPMGRVGQPEEEANLVAFLVSEEASFITGATVDVNGGQLMM